MTNEVDEVRKLLTEGATQMRIVVAIAMRCGVHYGKRWRSATIAQVMHILHVDILTARALVSEYAGVESLNGDWKRILHNLGM